MKICRYNPLFRFTVTSVLNSTILPESSGFIIKPLNTNIYKTTCHLIFTKRGKKGKNRIEYLGVKVLTVLDEDIDIEKEIVKNKIYIHSKNIVKLETVQVKENILSMSNIDFLGWAIAYIYYLRSIIPPQENGFDEKTPEGILINKYYNEFDYVYHLANNIEFRKQFLYNMRRHHSFFIKSISAYNNNMKKVTNDIAAVLDLKAVYVNLFNAKSKEVKRINAFKKTLEKQIME